MQQDCSPTTQSSADTGSGSCAWATPVIITVSDSTGCVYVTQGWEACDEEDDTDDVPTIPPKLLTTELDEGPSWPTGRGRAIGPRFVAPLRERYILKSGWP